jgi:ribosomal protein S18 acetylase RimI-like enzyme
VLLDPASRGKGYGRALVAAAIDAAIAGGTSRIDLNVIAGNLPAIATYRSLGFVVLGPNPEHPDMTRMRLDTALHPSRRLG